MNILPPPPPPPYPPPTSIHKLQQRKLPHHTLSEDEDLFAGTSFASEQESIAESLAGCKVSPSNDSYPTFASVEAQFLTKNEIICQGCSAKDEDSNGTHGKENHSPKSESWPSVEKLKPLPAGEVRGIASTVHMWKTKRKQHRERKSPSGRKSKSTHADNDTTPDMSKNNRKSPTSNFFMQMGDDEVGNHPNSDVHTQVTEPTLSNSSSTKTNSSSMQGKGIIIFQPHASAGEDFDYYLTPIRGTSCKTKTNVTIDKKSESPQSVMERIGSSVSSMHGGAGSSASSKNAALTSFPRYAKESVKLHRRRSKPQFNSGKLNRHDSSCDNSDNNGDIDDASVGTGISIAKTITDSLPPALMKLHDLIIGTSCWDVSRSRCVEGARDHVAQECNDEEGEERSNGSIGHSYSSNDDDDDASFYSSCDSSRSGNNRGGSKKEATLQTTKKSGGGQKQEHRTGRRSFLRRRGRSPTIKEGFNSDGESLRSRSRGSRASRGSRGSFSLSVDSSLGDDIEASPSCGKDIGVSVTSTYRTSPMVPLEEPIELRDSAGCVVGVGGGGGSETSTSSSANADFENTRYGSDPSGVVKHASGFAAAKGSAVDGSNSCTDSNDSVVCAASIITAENVLSFDQAMWRSMTQEKPPLTGRVDKRDEDNPRIAGSENSESSAQERYCVNASMEATTIEGYFKKILTVGIKLILNDPPASGSRPRLTRNGRMFLKFGTQSNGSYESPRLQWTDGNIISHTLELLDIEMIRQATESELKGIYPFAIAAHSFFISNKDGLSLLFEAVDELQMTRIITALRGIIARFVKKIVAGESDWVGQMMLVSTAPVVKFEELEDMVTGAMSDVSKCLVKKTAFTVLNESDIKSKKTAWIRQARERRTRLLHRKTKTT